MNLRFEPVNVSNTETDEGRLVFLDDQLVAVLSRLSPMQEERAGLWFMEALFGPLALVDTDHETFADLDKVAAWFEKRLNGSQA